MSYEVREQPYKSGKYVIVNTGKNVWLKANDPQGHRFRSLKAAKQFVKSRVRA
jgi:hypothetical protein